jgi:hypothetical protein
VHEFWSLQFLSVCVQLPFEQASSVQGLLSAQSLAVWKQLPLSQTSSVQALASSQQTLLVQWGNCMQLPVCGSQVASKQGSNTGGHFETAEHSPVCGSQEITAHRLLSSHFGVPLHEPVLQTSFSVQASLSLQEALL